MKKLKKIGVGWGGGGGVMFKITEAPLLDHVGVNSCSLF